MIATLWRAVGVLAGAAGGAAAGWGIVKAFEGGAGYVAIALGALAAVTIGLYRLARPHSDANRAAGQFMSNVPGATHSTFPMWSAPATPAGT